MSTILPFASSQTANFSSLIQDEKYKYFYNALGQLVKVTLINDSIVMIL
ncbi:hypothetical protein ACQKCU_24590 [Heyndrickxia sporothermodurans]